MIRQIVISALVFLGPLSVWAQSGSRLVDDTLHEITTLVVTTNPFGTGQGTGFYYQRLAPKVKEGPQWRAITDVWLVVNRHTVLPKIQGKEIRATSLSFHLRRIEGDNLHWDPITLTQADLFDRARFHTNPKVDVCVISVHDLLMQKISTGKYMQWSGVTNEDLPGQNKIKVAVTDDAVVVGYPENFYDKKNLFPIVKSGIVASRWGAHFNGEPSFLIDAQLFPGSSGSIVITKPTDLIVEDGRLLTSKAKEFAFLGIFSGEPYANRPPIEFPFGTFILKQTWNLGVVWYGELIEEMVSKGIAHTASMADVAVEESYSADTNK